LSFLADISLQKVSSHVTAGVVATAVTDKMSEHYHSSQSVSRCRAHNCFTWCLDKSHNCTRCIADFAGVLQTLRKPV